MNRYSTPSSEYSGLTKTQQIKHCAKVLFGAYRKDQFADPESFLIQAGVVFEQYEEIVIRYVTDVRNHDCLQRRYDWPPTIKEISDACDAQEEKVARARAFANQPRPSRYIPPAVDKHPGYRANVFIGQDVPQYSEIVQLADSGTLDPYDWRFGQSSDGKRAGIWITLTIWETRYTIARHSTFKPLSDDELRAHYGRQEAELARERQKATATTEETRS